MHINNNVKYNLYAVVNHYGSINGGHYTSHTKNAINNLWYEFNDSNVVHIDPENLNKEIITNSGYILFYKKQNV